MQRRKPMVVTYGLFSKDESDIFINALLFTCAIFTIALISTHTATEIRPFSVSTHSIGITFACFRACTFIDVCNWGQNMGIKY